MSTTIGFASMDWSTIPGPDSHPTPGGSGWYRCHLPQQALAAAGVETHIGRLIFNRRHGVFGVREWGAEDGSTDHFDCRIVVLQRWMLQGLWDDIAIARSHGQIVVQDVDDWFFGLASQNLASRALNVDPRSNLSHYRKVLIASDLVTTSTPYLAQRLSSFLPNVRLVRNHIDIDEPGRWPQTLQRSWPVLGWAGAIPWRSGDLETLRGILGTIVERGTPFHHAGFIDHPDWPSAGDVLRLPPGRCTTSPMATVAEWPHRFADFDIGIVPLSDRPFNEAKSAVKGMEYVAAGKPFVAQATGEYKWLAGLGVGRAAQRPRDWHRQLGELLTMSAEEREVEAKANQEALRAARLTTEHLAEAWLDAVVGGLEKRRVAL